VEVKRTSPCLGSGQDGKEEVVKEEVVKEEIVKEEVVKEEVGKQVGKVLVLGRCA